MRMWVAVVCVVAASLGGCIVVGSSNSNPPTSGQQLTDLKLALDRGAITQQEYDQQKAAILAGRK